MAAATPVVFITGASSGIGYATAVAFIKRGYHVAGTARRADRLTALQTEIAGLSGAHGEFLPLVADVRDAAALQSAVHQTVERFGRLDVLVANAGLGQRGAVVDAKWEDLDTLLRTNIDGVLHSIRAAVPAIRQTGQGGQIVIVSSVMYNMTAPYVAAYAASKAAVSSFARSLRLELEHENIGVSDLLVGRTITEFSANRLGEAGRSGGGSMAGIPEMPASQVADAIVAAAEHHHKTRSLRLIDALIVLLNKIAPEIIGRRAIRQYKP